MYYLAYGSNLNTDMMNARCGTSKIVGKTKIDGYRLVFRGSMDGFGYLTLESDVNSSVDLGIFDINEDALKLLDKAEGYPTLYRKEMINVDGMEALIYLMNNEFGYAKPSLRYFNVCLEGFNEFGFNDNALYDAYEYTISKIEGKKRENEIQKSLCRNNKPL